MDSLEIVAVAALLELGAYRIFNTNHHDKRQDMSLSSMSILETQQHQEHDMVSLCMRTIKKMETDPSALHKARSSGMKPDPMSSESSSDSEEQMTCNNDSNIEFMKEPIKTPDQLNRAIDCYSNNYTESPLVSHQAHQRRGSLVNSTAVNLMLNSNQIVKPTLDKAMQTDDLPRQVPVEKLEELEAVVVHVHTRFLKLVESRQLNQQVLPTPHSDEEQNPTLASKRERNEQVLGDEINGSQYSNDSNVETKGHLKAHNSKSLHVRRVSVHTTNTEQDTSSRDDMVPIGSGKAVVPARIWNQLDWTSHELVTRQLLHAFFSREDLVRHSLTRKQSQAFTNMPAKKPLDPKLIDDIVDTVSDRCKVPKRAVRYCITIKCTDEAKLYRNRMQGRQERPPKVPAVVDNGENVPLSP